jgi:hypothetical protein
MRWRERHTVPSPPSPVRSVDATLTDSLPASDPPQRSSGIAGLAPAVTRHQRRPRSLRAAARRLMQRVAALC